jgi:hypothetical protein
MVVGGIKIIAMVFAAFWFAAGGALALFCGAILLSAESIPVRELRQDELEAIALSAQYVTEHHKATSNYPTDEEFRAWSNENKESLPKTTTLSYSPPFRNHPRYSFELWDGDCHATWHPEPAGNTKAYIDPGDYFMFGRSKATALAWCFGWGSLFWGFAFLFVKPLVHFKQS